MSRRPPRYVHGVEVSRKGKPLKRDHQSNRESVDELLRRFEAFSEVRKHSPEHWTLTFQNGGRLEIFPHLLGAGGSMHYNLFETSFELLCVAENCAEEDRMGDPDGFDVLEDL